MYITKLKEHEEYLNNYIKEHERDLWLCQDKDLIKIWEIELDLIKGVLRLVRKAKREVVCMTERKE